MEQERNIESRIDELLSDHAKFSSAVYLPIHDAIRELDRRQDDGRIDEYLLRVLPGGVPEPLVGEKSIILFRHIATSNYEVCRFISLTDSLEGFQPLVLEYTEDLFTNRNECKYFLGRICLANGMNRNQEDLYECHNVIDFNTSNSRPINAINTSWGQPLVDFHHGMLFDLFPDFRDHVHDLSGWLHSHGSRAKEYYKPFLSLLIKHAILFENFLVDSNERPFIKNVILPAFLEIEAETGLKPLIVALAPSEIEDSRFWLAHPNQKKEHIVRLLGK